MREKKSDFIAFRAPEDLRKKLETVAEKEDRSVSYMIIKILSKHFEKSKLDEK